MHQGFYEILGEGRVLLTAPHAGGPVADVFTGDIVEDVSLRTGCPALVGNTSREKLDLNRAEAFDTSFRRSIDELTEKTGIQVILDIHGKEKPGVEVGTAVGETASWDTTSLVAKCLSSYFQVDVNKKYKGLKHGSVITTYSKKGPEGTYLVEAVQLEFGFRERSTLRDKAVSGVSEIVNSINQKKASR